MTMSTLLSEVRQTYLNKTVGIIVLEFTDRKVEIRIPVTLLLETGNRHHDLCNHALLALLASGGIHLGHEFNANGIGIRIDILDGSGWRRQKVEKKDEGNAEFKVTPEVVYHVRRLAGIILWDSKI